MDTSTREPSTGPCGGTDAGGEPQGGGERLGRHREVPCKPTPEAGPERGAVPVAGERPGVEGAGKGAKR